MVMELKARFIARKLVRKEKLSTIQNLCLQLKKIVHVIGLDTNRM
jgi:hypothetical protein